MPRPLTFGAFVPQAVSAPAKRLGGDIRTARVRRRITQRELAAKAGLSYDTLRAVESGSLVTGLGAYIAVCWALGLTSGWVQLMDPDNDEVGKALERAAAPQRVRPKKRKTSDYDF